MILLLSAFLKVLNVLLYCRVFDAQDILCKNYFSRHFFKDYSLSIGKYRTLLVVTVRFPFKLWLNIIRDGLLLLRPFGVLASFSLEGVCVILSKYFITSLVKFGKLDVTVYKKRKVFLFICRL